MRAACNIDGDLDACLNCGNPAHRVVDCKHPKEETRIRTNMDLFQKHRKQSAAAQAKFNLVTPPQMVATFNSMRAECHALTQKFDAIHQHSDDESSDEAHLHTGDTTEAETDLDENDDEESDLENDHEDEGGDKQDDGLEDAIG